MGTRIKGIKTLLILLIIAAFLCACQNTGSNPPAASSVQGDGTASNPSGERLSVRVVALKGPSGMGLVGLMDKNDRGETANSYEFTLADAPDKVSPMVINGEVDIAALPTNMASVLYNKTQKEVTALGVSTLGNLYILVKDATVSSVDDLRGKTIYATGQGATPEYLLRHILSKNGIDPEKDVTIEFKSEHAELATLIVAGKAPIAMLPEPFFVTNVVSQEAGAEIALDLTEEWAKVEQGIVVPMTTVVVRNEFLSANPVAVNNFLDEYRLSAEFTNNNIDEASVLIEKYNIIAKAALAKQAIPRCNIVYLDNSEGGKMKTAVDTFLNVLFEANPQSIGGALPDDAFYYQR